jgi:hypothetical protein
MFFSLLHPPVQYDVRPLLAQLTDFTRKELPKSWSMQNQSAGYLPK